MNTKMIISIFIVLGLYMSLCYYIGLKGKRIFLDTDVKFKHKRYCLIYWLIYWIIALAFILSNILRGLLTTDNWITAIVTLIGTTYIGVFIYSILTFFVVDVIKFILKKINSGQQIKQNLKKIYCNGISVFMIVFILVGLGIWNAQNKVVTNLEVKAKL